MATVYLARTRGPGGFQRLVAIKVCHEHLSSQPRYKKMFLDEARLAGRIHNPNVVSTLDVDDGSPPFLVMEYVEGASLSVLQRKAQWAGQRLPVSGVLRIIVDALAGLQAAHELRDDDGKLLHLVHRDVSPQNILVGTDGLSRLTDFGVAKAEARLAATAPGEVKGKFSYMAPEQLSANDVSPRCDVFSAATALWEALTGKRLFKGDTVTDAVSLVLSGPIRWPSKLRRGISSDLDAVVMHGLERDPVRRYQTAEEFAAALRECGENIASPEEVGALVQQLASEELDSFRAALDASPNGSPQPPSPDEQSAPPPSQDHGVIEHSAQWRWKTFAISVGVILALCVVVVSSWWILEWFLFEPSQPDRSPPTSITTSTDAPHVPREADAAPRGGSTNREPTQTKGLGSEPATSSSPDSTKVQEENDRSRRKNLRRKVPRRSKPSPPVKALEPSAV